MQAAPPVVPVPKPVTYQIVPTPELTWKSVAFEVVSTAVSYALLYFGCRALLDYVDPLGKQKKAAEEDRKRMITKLERSGRRGFETNEYESIVCGDLVYPDDIDVTFQMIGGHKATKDEIFDLVALPLRRPELFRGRSKLIAPPKGILLYGPPGTGKTMMAKAIARESGAAFINFKMSTVMNKWFGESQKIVRATFSLAQKLAPTIIFIDEIDSFLRERRSDDHAAQSNMKAEFMALWDGLTTEAAVDADAQDGGPGYGVIVVGATNRPWDVDAAILRRLPRQFELGLPDAEQRAAILALLLEGEPLERALQEPHGLRGLADSLEGYSGSDLKELCRAAAMGPFREFAAKERSVGSGEVGADSTLRPLQASDFVAAAKLVQPTGQAAFAYKSAREEHEDAQQREWCGTGAATGRMPTLEQQHAMAMALLSQLLPPEVFERSLLRQPSPQQRNTSPIRAPSPDLDDSD